MKVISYISNNLAKKLRKAYFSVKENFLLPIWFFKFLNFSQLTFSHYFYRATHCFKILYANFQQVLSCVLDYAVFVTYVHNFLKLNIIRNLLFRKKV